MPSKPLRPCAYPGCVTLVRHGSYCEKHKSKPTSQVFKRDKNRQSLYDTARWKKLRQRQLALHPWCEHCLLAGVYTLATDVDHIERHFGDHAKFYEGKLQSLCHSCPAKKTRKEINADS
jgi:5-methylcytosine-specific restriction protein A